MAKTCRMCDCNVGWNDDGSFYCGNSECSEYQIAYKTCEYCDGRGVIPNG